MTHGQNALVTRGDRALVERFFAEAGGPALLAPTPWARAWVFALGGLALTGYLLASRFGAPLAAAAGMAEPDRAAETLMLWSATAAGLMGACALACVLWRLQIELRNRRRAARGRLNEQRNLDALHRVRRHDLIRARLRAARSVEPELGHLAPFDAPDPCGRDVEEFGAASERLLAAEAKSVFFYGPPALTLIRHLALVEGGERMAFEVNPIRATTLFLTEDRIVVAQALIDLVAGATLEETVTRVSLRDLVRLQYHERRMPAEAIARGEGALGCAQPLLRRMTGRGRPAFHLERGLLLTFADGGAVELPLGQRLTVESAAAAERDEPVQDDLIRDELVRRVDARVMERKLRLQERGAF